MIKSANRILKIVFINIALLLFLIALIEGATSLVLVVNDYFKTTVPIFVTERIHTQYDPLLGWINSPNVRFEDMYGKGVYLATNSQSFRNTQNFPVEVPPNKLRIICTGDSFTLGYGVSNDDTWCQKLTQLDPIFETVNMGQGGYGVDQAYLWYQRDGVKLNHDILLFAFITGDFYRMDLKNFYGYPKPFLTVRDGKIVTENVPVSKDKAGHSERMKLSSIFGGFQFYKFFTRLHWKVKRLGSKDGVLGKDAYNVVDKILEELKETNISKHSELVLVHLPSVSDYKGDKHSVLLRKTLKHLSNRKGIIYFDLIDDLNKLSNHFDVEALYLYGNLHYSSAGNKFIAQALYNKLRLLDKVIAKRDSR